MYFYRLRREWKATAAFSRSQPPCHVQLNDVEDDPALHDRRRSSDGGRARAAGLRCDLPAPGESGLLRIRAKGEQAPVTVLHDELP